MNSVGYRNLIFLFTSLVLGLSACGQGIGLKIQPGGPTATSGLLNQEETPTADRSFGSPPPAESLTSEPALPAVPPPVAVTPVMDPTRLPEPHLVEVLDWVLVTADSEELCANCLPDQVVIETPRGLEIAAVRIYSQGEAGDAAIIETDLSFSQGVECQADRPSQFCGMIFGQVSGGQLTLTARHTAGGPHRLIYFITLQRWADYKAP